MISAVAANPFGRDLAVGFIEANWVAGLGLFALYGPGGFDLSSLARAAQSLSSSAWLADVQDFFAANPVPGASHDLNQALESIGRAINWREASGEAAATCTWLG